jgi:hypothetical protein
MDVSQPTIQSPTASPTHTTTPTNQHELTTPVSPINEAVTTSPIYPDNVSRSPTKQPKHPLSSSSRSSTATNVNAESIGPDDLQSPIHHRIELHGTKDDKSNRRKLYRSLIALIQVVLPQHQASVDWTSLAKLSPAKLAKALLKTLINCPGENNSASWIRSTQLQQQLHQSLTASIHANNKKAILEQMAKLGWSADNFHPIEADVTEYQIDQYFAVVNPTTSGIGWLLDALLQTSNLGAEGSFTREGLSSLVDQLQQTGSNLVTAISDTKLKLPTATESTTPSDSSFLSWMELTLKYQDRLATSRQFHQLPHINPSSKHCVPLCSFEECLRLHLMGVVAKATHSRSSDDQWVAITPHDSMYEHANYMKFHTAVVDQSMDFQQQEKAVSNGSQL